MTTTTLYKIIQSELLQKGYNEFIDKEGNLVIFDTDYQFMTKIISFDEDVESIVNSFFNGLCLENEEYDTHFKKNFLYRFINRKINKQTIESFKLELMSTFLMNEDYINRIYGDLEKYLTQKATSEGEDNQENKQENSELNTQKTDGTSNTDNRSAFTELPQSSVNIDVDNTSLEYASDNTITRNKQVSNQDVKGETTGTSTGETSGTNRSENRLYQLDELFKTNGLLEQIYNVFDTKCFLQVW